MAPARQLILLCVAAAAFGVGYVTGRSSSSLSCAAASGEVGVSCPAPIPCVCDCAGLPQRRLTERATGKAPLLPFSVEKKYDHVAPAFGGGEDQHKGGSAGKIPERGENVPAPAPRPASADAPPPAAAANDVAAKTAADAASWRNIFAGIKGGGAQAAAGGAAPPPADAAVPLPVPPAARPPPQSENADGVPTVGAAGDRAQCALPTDFRGVPASSLLDRPQVDVPFYVKTATGAEKVVMKAYSTVAPGSRSDLSGSDLWALAGANQYEPKRFAALRAAFAARPGGDFIEYGAWIGVSTLYAGALGAGKMLSLEPDPRAFDELWANVVLNPAVAERAWVYRHCVSDRDELRTVNTVLGSTAYASNGFQESRMAPEDRLSSYAVRCSTVGALADAHGLTPATTAFVFVNTVPGMELVIAGDLHDWVKSTPEGVPKPSLWLTLYTHKWGDKALGHHALMPLVRLFKFKYTTHLNPVDMELVERRGEGPCPSEYHTCHILLTDTELRDSA